MIRNKLIPSYESELNVMFRAQITAFTIDFVSDRLRMQVTFVGINFRGLVFNFCSMYCFSVFVELETKRKKYYLGMIFFIIMSQGGKKS